MLDQLTIYFAGGQNGPYLPTGSDYIESKSFILAATAAHPQLSTFLCYPLQVG